MVPQGFLESSIAQSFRPLTGIVPMKHSAIRKRGRFRPLAGIVLVSWLVMKEKPGFRPLTGIVP